MRFEKIGRLTDIAKTWNPQKSGLVGTFSYVDIGSVDHQTKTISNVSKLAYAEAPSRARQLVQAGDVLVSTVRPNLNAVAVVPAELDGATVSTGFCVLKPTPELIGRYLFNWVKSPEFVRDMTARATGQSYPAVSDRIVRESCIPLPSTLAEQRAIAEILDQVDELTVKRHQSVALLDDLAQSVFLEMFGDPGAGRSHWTRSTVAAVADRVTDGEHITPKREENGIKLLSARNIRDGYVDFENVDYISIGEYERLRKRCNPQNGDVLISCSGTIGRVATVETDEPLALVRSVALIKPNRSMITSTYLATYLRTPALKAEMLRRANSSSQANLFQGPIRALPILVPPLDLQCDFSRCISEIAVQKSVHRTHLAALDALFASLQHRAFRGEL